MADKIISDLPLASRLNDNSLLVVEQVGQAMHMTGAQFKEFARESTRSHALQAESARDSAFISATEAAQSAANSANSANISIQYGSRPPTIRNDTWWIWDANKQQYVDTGEPSKGLNGVAVSTNGLWAFDVRDSDGHLILRYTGDDVPDVKIKDDGHLYVTL